MLQAVTRFSTCLFAAVVALCMAGQAQAQAWPAKPVRLIVPFAAGGTTDVVARVLGQKLAEAWGQPTSPPTPRLCPAWTQARSCSSWSSYSLSPS